MADNTNNSDNQQSFGELGKIVSDKLGVDLNSANLGDVAKDLQERFAKLQKMTPEEKSQLGKDLLDKLKSGKTETNDK
jgi:hypothetical protein